MTHNSISGAISLWVGFIEIINSSLLDIVQMILNLFTEGSQIQTYEIVRELH